MNDLDSRFLRLGDCFAQKFSRRGSYRYTVTTAAGSCLPRSALAHTILVKPRGAGGKSAQHDIVVKREGTTLVADPAEVEIETGDMVLWHTPDAAISGFAVVGEGEGENFSSLALTVEAVYSHAFGTPGHYEWVDAHGGKLRGEVNVQAPKVREPADCKKWLESLDKGTLIKVADDRSAPERVDILAGQTVFWAVERAAGISITDSRLVRKVPAQ